MRARRGLTIIEMMVAIILLGVGMLGLAGFSLAAGTQAKGAALQQTAALVVQSRLDSLASVTCTGLAASGSQWGTATTLGVQEKWIIADGNDIKTITDTVRFGSRKRPLVYQSIIPCRD
jgi:prepilin-type N-terminal cleavage/methylation domain-containing protein